MSSPADTYTFVFRGLMAEEALDGSGRVHHDASGVLDSEIAARLSIDLLDDGLVAAAKRMANVYTAVAAFENSVRLLVTKTMIEAHGDAWWGTVSEKVRKRAETRLAEEEKHRFHTQRGDTPLNYTDLSDLLNIIRANEDSFAPFFPSPEWAKSIFDAIERSRNVIMHSGTIEAADIEWQ